ncbi:hypothetical protein ACK3TF_004138 [Chlorella vulgaris]
MSKAGGGTPGTPASSSDISAPRNSSAQQSLLPLLNAAPGSDAQLSARRLEVGRKEIQAEDVLTRECAACRVKRYLPIQKIPVQHVLFAGVLEQWQKGVGKPHRALSALSKLWTIDGKFDTNRFFSELGGAEFRQFKFTSYADFILAAKDMHDPVPSDSRLLRLELLGSETPWTKHSSSALSKGGWQALCQAVQGMCDIDPTRFPNDTAVFKYYAEALCDENGKEVSDVRCYRRRIAEHNNKKAVGSEDAAPPQSTANQSRAEQNDLKAFEQRMDKKFEELTALIIKQVDELKQQLAGLQARSK